MSIAVRMRVTGIRKGDCTAQVVTFHDELDEALDWVAKHAEEENNAHAYQLLPQTSRDSDGWKSKYAYYMVDGNLVNESEWLKAIATKKEVTQ